jgi:membrane-bound lytic murein transglycosylase D
MTHRIRHKLALTLLLPLMGCAVLRPTSVAPVVDQGVAVHINQQSVGKELVKAVRWHLWRAFEEEANSLYSAAQGDLDTAFHLFAAIDRNEMEDAATEAEIESLGQAIEDAYLHLLPNLETFSADSPLILLLEGLSDEKIEELPPDAAPLVRIHQLANRCDIPIDANAAVAASIHFFQTRGRKTFAVWLQRSGRYRDLILDILADEGMPRDLLYVAMIESGFKTNAYSRARAVGMWQFIEQTGKLEGLSKTHWVDERRDPLRSTRAAARHLRRLHDYFGDWRLALAAYNAGLGRVSRAIQRSGSRDFWALDLPRETRNYVPLFMAVAIMGKDPTLFGFDELQLEPPLRFETVDLPRAVRLEKAAECMGLSLTALRQLNPELRQSITPPQKGRHYDLRVPPGKGRTLLKCSAEWPEEELAWHYYKVKRNDSIWSIAREFGISTKLIIEANSIADPSRIYLGQKLYIPGAAGADKSPHNAVATRYTIKPGDSLSRIARRYKVRVADLKQWNQLQSNTIRAGEQLTVWAASKTRATSLKTTTVVDPNGREMHTIQIGESLWSIARRYDVHVEDLRQWNGLEHSIIYPGQKLTVSRASVALGQDQHYTVTTGDTLYSIAQEFGLEAAELARLNNMSLSTTLLVGTNLKVKPTNLME